VESQEGIRSGMEITGDNLSNICSKIEWILSNRCVVRYKRKARKCHRRALQRSLRVAYAYIISILSYRLGFSFAGTREPPKTAGTGAKAEGPHVTPAAQR